MGVHVDAVDIAPRHTPWLTCIGIGLVAGFLSGMFGVGGGILIVPALTMLARMNAKVASGTSLLAIVPCSVVGAITYGLAGNVNVALAALLALGSVVGAPIGSRLLQRVSQDALRVLFMAFMAVVIVSLFVVIPARDGMFEIDLLRGVGLVALGFGTGILSGLLGIGGGVVIVPMLVLLFGSSDLIAKGSSLLMMIATGASGTVSNVRRGTVDVRAAVAVGGAAAVTTIGGAAVARALPPAGANVAFAVFLVFIMVRMGLEVRRSRRRRRRVDAGAGSGSGSGSGAAAGAGAVAPVEERG